MKHKPYIKKELHTKSKLSDALTDLDNERKGMKVKRQKKRNPKEEERALVLKLVEELQSQTDLDLLIEIDTDSPARVFKSGYDFTVAYDGRIEYFEAKRSLGKPAKDPLKLLTPHQRVKAFECVLAKMTYHILEFIVIDEWVQIHLHVLGLNRKQDVFDTDLCVLGVVKSDSIIEFIAYYLACRSLMASENLIVLKREKTQTLST